MTKRALFLISDTGGGHRSASNAITAALDEITEPVSFEHRIEDVAAHCSFPLTQLGLGYSMALRYAPPVYGALYYATNGRRRYRALVRFCEPLYRERLRDLFLSYGPDVIVSVHPLLNHAALRARADAQLEHVPIVTVITDLGKVHESWLMPDADAVVVPAREVYERALSRGISPNRLRLLGQPIHPQPGPGPLPRPTPPSFQWSSTTTCPDRSAATSSSSGTTAWARSPSIAPPRSCARCAR